MFKLFLNKPLPKENLTFSNNEKLIFHSILHKKKIKFDENIELNEESMNKINRQFYKKKRETYLKFVFPKCVKYLRKVLTETHDTLFNNHLCLKKLSKLNRDMIFYNHYFKEIAETQKIPIESFILFKNWTHRFSDHIPKSVNLQMVNLWKKNPTLVNDMLRYLNERFFKDFFDFNKEKIESLIIKWGSMVVDIGEDKTVEKIVDSLKKKQSKLPWSLAEVEYAVQKTKSLLTS